MRTPRLRVCVIYPYTFDLFGDNRSLAFFGAVTSVAALFDFTENKLKNKLKGEKYNEKTSFACLAFSYCKNLTNVVIPDSVTSIGNYAFSFCDNLTSVIIGNGVTSIGNNAFRLCPITNLVIGSSVTYIGFEAFSLLSELASIYYAGTIEEWLDITISELNNNLIKATRYYYSENKPEVDGNYWHYVDGVPGVWE